MVTIVFEPHGTTTDNEQRLASGHVDVALSALGQQQSREMGERYSRDDFAAIFCSDLQRSYRSGEIAFGRRGWPILRDARLRECNYGELDGHPKAEVDPLKPAHINKTFPGGESYQDTNRRMRSFLLDLARDYDGKKVMIIGHRATQYALESLINHRPLEEVVPEPWKWQPGWTYRLSRLAAE